MKKVINSGLSRRHFLRLTSVAAASALTPTVLWAEQCHSACNIDPLSRGIGVQN
ncbi:twin-arginine translocation signal domain-containing protein [Bradyrhizobium sp. 215_C5_N1_1]|uniref:twin-arginine translocation signal domain-containing protein n=1 Tax=unclassified Bradyrhizobium TaxID=2631580 RepID=UPI003F8B09EC